MIIGDSSIFAIESGIMHAYKRLSLRALGFFVIHVGGYRYGVCSPDATMLACSFDEVRDRLTRRGRHNAPFAIEPDAGKIADAFRCAIYAPDHEKEQFFGIPQPEFLRLVSGNHIQWAPDGDGAFDDGSYVLHFDIKDKVRLIAFQSLEKSYLHAPSSLKEVWLNANEFYSVLQSWCDAFEAEWLGAPKVAENELTSHSDMKAQRDGK